MREMSKRILNNPINPRTPASAALNRNTPALVDLQVLGAITHRRAAGITVALEAKGVEASQMDVIRTETSKALLKVVGGPSPTTFFRLFSTYQAQLQH